MRAFLQATSLFIQATANHFFLMMYWIWVPALLLTGFLSARFHQEIRERLASAQGWKAWLYGGGLGLTGSLDRRRRLEDAKWLLGNGAPPSAALAFAVAGHHLVPYSLAIVMALVGLEFALGQALGGLAMAGIVSLLASRLPRAVGEERLMAVSAGGGGLTPERRSRQSILGSIGGEIKAIWLPILYGLILAGVIATLGYEPWWVDLSQVGGGGLLTELLNVTVGPLLAIVTFALPGANPFIAAFLWKAFTLSYAGVLSFILASAINPWALLGYARAFGRRPGAFLLFSGFVGSALGALFVQGVFWLFGLQVTHVPWFHELANRLMNFFALRKGMNF